MKPFILLTLLLCACQTDMKFENAVPGATLHNLRFEVRDSSYVAQGQRLLAGQTSQKISISPGDAGASGTIHFELEVDGRRVALRTPEASVAVEDEGPTFTIGPDTPVDHLLVEDTTMALWAE